MNTELIELPTYELSKSLTEIEADLLSLPQARIDVIHKFIPGYYIREMRATKGTMAMGAHHKYHTANTFVSGEILVRLANGDTKILSEPCTFISEPGRKCIYAITDIVWQNWWKTDITDVSILDSILLEVEETPSEISFHKYMAEWLSHETDRQDYVKAIEDGGYILEEIEKLTRNTDDQIPLPYGEYKFRLGISSIDGTGTIATADIEPGEVIGLGRVGKMRTPLGRYMNHSTNPNAVGEYRDGNIYVVATRYIKGDGSVLGRGDEITVDYRESMKLARSIEE